MKNTTSSLQKRAHFPPLWGNEEGHTETYVNQLADQKRGVICFGAPFLYYVAIQGIIKH